MTQHTRGHFDPIKRGHFDPIKGAHFDPFTLSKSPISPFLLGLFLTYFKLVGTPGILLYPSKLDFVQCDSDKKFWHLSQECNSRLISYLIYKQFEL